MAKYPPMIGAVVAMRSPGTINNTIQEQQTGSIELSQRIKADRFPVNAAVARSGNNRTAYINVAPVTGENSIRDHDRAAELHGSRCEVESIQSLHVMRAATADFLGFCHNIKSLGIPIDHRRSRDANFGYDVARENILRRDSGNAVWRINKTHVPEEAHSTVVRIEGVDAVVLGRDKHYIANSAARNLKAGYIKRLRVNITINR